MRRFFVRFNRSESFVHTQSSAGFTIITSGFEFSVHTTNGSHEQVEVQLMVLEQCELLARWRWTPVRRRAPPQTSSSVSAKSLTVRIPRQAWLHVRRWYAMLGMPSVPLPCRTKAPTARPTQLPCVPAIRNRGGDAPRCIQLIPVALGTYIASRLAVNQLDSLPPAKLYL
jgi:hypothetical protein